MTNATGPLGLRHAESFRPCAGREKIIFFFFVVYVSTFAFEGVLRYGLAVTGAPNAIYLRDALAFGVIAYLFLWQIYFKHWLDIAIATIVLLLGIHLIIGILSGNAIFQSLFGAKIFLPMVLGAAIWPLVNRRPSWFILSAWFFFILTAVGVILNYTYGILPWEAFEYQTMFGVVETTREWWMMGGIRRLSGFARTSVHAAGILGLTGGILMAMSPSVRARLFVALLGGVAIVLTTSKAMALIYLILSGWLLFAPLWRSLILGRLIVFVIVLFALIIPLLSLVYSFGDGRALPFIVSSFLARLNYMWPEAFDLITSPINAIVGNGLGSIGSAQQFGYVPKLMNTADNVFVFFYVSFGIFGYVYLLFLVVSLTLSEGSLSRFSYVCIAGLVAFFGYGLTSNMVEQAFAMVLLGIGFGAAISQFEGAGKHVESEES